MIDDYFGFLVKRCDGTPNRRRAAGYSYYDHRARFNSLDELVEWYNNRPHGLLYLRWTETPNEAFIRKMWPEVWFGFAAKSFKW